MKFRGFFGPKPSNELKALRKKAGAACLQLLEAFARNGPQEENAVAVQVGRVLHQLKEQIQEVHTDVYFVAHARSTDEDRRQGDEEGTAKFDTRDRAVGKNGQELQDCFFSNGRRRTEEGRLLT